MFSWYIVTNIPIDLLAVSQLIYIYICIYIKWMITVQRAIHCNSSGQQQIFRYHHKIWCCSLTSFGNLLMSVFNIRSWFNQSYNGEDYVSLNHNSLFHSILKTDVLNEQTIIPFARTRPLGRDLEARFEVCTIRLSVCVECLQSMDCNYPTRWSCWQLHLWIIRSLPGLNAWLKGPLEHSDSARVEVAKRVVSSPKHIYILQGRITLKSRFSLHTFD